MNNARTSPTNPADASATTSLGLWDATSLVVGIVVGTAIFRSSPVVFQNTTGPWAALGAWALGGVLSLVGALCYAELATTYPRAGGDYEYLTRAFGPWAGFLFGWAQLTAVFSANLGAMAYAFGDYGVELFGLGHGAVVWLAVLAIVGMSLLNAWTVHAGSWTQIVLTLVKVIGLGAVILAAALAPAASTLEQSSAEPTPSAESASTPTESVPSFGLAMVFVLYAYGGWSDAAFVASEVRNRHRNMPLAIIGGVAAITVIYLAMNWAYLRTLGFDQARISATPAADALAQTVGSASAKLVSALVMISALGAINGMILSRSRMFAVLGEDHRVLSWLGGWKPGQGTPRASLAAQAVVTLAMVWYFGGFETIVAATAPVFWALLLATGVAMIVLRQCEPQRERPFQAPLYPLTPLVFCGTCGYMLYSSVDYARWLAVAGAAPAALGLVLYLATRSR